MTRTFGYPSFFAVRARNARRCVRAFYDMKGLGRGLVIDRDDPASVRQGLQQFAHGAKSRMALLQGAGFIDRDFAAIDARIAELQEIESDQTARRAVKSGVIDRIWAFTLAIEGCFRTYRARVRLAAGDDAALMSRLNAPLPRHDERRRPAGETKAPLPISDAIAPTQSSESKKDE